MSMSRREFLQVLAAAAASGLVLDSRSVLAGSLPAQYYDAPPIGNVSFMHITDVHAQLMPIWFREPSINLGVGAVAGHPPHLVGESFLKNYGIKPGTADAHAFTYLDFRKAAKVYGKIGGFAHLKTLVDQVRGHRPGALLLDGGDTWQGSGTALWSKGQDMVDACIELGVNVMTSHWECTYGAQRMTEVIDNDFKRAGIDFVAQNIVTNDFGDQVFKPYVMKEINGVPVAIVGQAFPYSAIANPRYMVPDWSFGIRDESMQKWVDEARAKGAQVVIVLSHNGMDVDLKMAGRVNGIDAIFGGHTHDGIYQPVPIKTPNGGTCLVTNAGSNGKFLGVMDFDVRNGKVTDWKYRLLPVFSNFIKPDAKMTALIDRVRAPYAAKLNEVLAISDDFLYRRGNFNGTWDQLILDALMAVKGADAAFSPGFRWGTTILPGEPITMERLLDQTAITYPYSTLTAMKGDQIKAILEDVGDNLFNPDPYYQQGGDMVRVGGIHYTVAPNAGMGQRISDMTLKGKPVEADKTYQVAGWAPVAEGASGVPIWDVVAEYLRAKKTIKGVKLNQPRIVGVGKHNPGMAI